MSQPKHVFTPEPQDGPIISIANFRGGILIACEYALYYATPVEGPVEWEIQKIIAGSPVPSCVRY